MYLFKGGFHSNLGGADKNLKYCEYFQKWVFLSRTARLIQVPNHNKHMDSWKAQSHGPLFISGNVHQKQVRNMKYVFVFVLFFFIVHFVLFHWWGSSVFVDSVLHFSVFFFFFFLHFICKHFVKMYILGKLFLYAIGMLYNALMFKLSVLYFFNCLVVIAQQNNVLEVINSD